MYRLQCSAVYNRVPIPNKGGCWWSSEQSTSIRAAADAVRILMKTSTQLSRCCWVRKTNHRATEQSEKSHVRRGIHRSSVLRIIHKNLRFKLLQEKGAFNSWQRDSMHALFSVCSLRDDNVMTSKPTWKLIHANFILASSFEYFCQISSKSIRIISSYRPTISNLGHYFWDTVYSVKLWPD